MVLYTCFVYASEERNGSCSTALCIYTQASTLFTVISCVQYFTPPSLDTPESRKHLPSSLKPRVKKLSTVRDLEVASDLTETVWLLFLIS